MNKQSLAILTAISEASPNGQPVIMEKDELVGAVPKENLKDFNFEEVIKELTLTELVKLKYSDGDTYCFIPLTKGKLLAENEKTQVLDTSFNLKIDYRRITKTAYKAAFTGALLGALISGLLFLLIELLV